MKFLLFRLAVFFISFHVLTDLYAQRQADNWYFGEYAGLNFRSDNPQPQPSSMIAYGASAVMSDRNTGQLLFYSNGEQVWNAQHEVMPNGYGLNGNKRTSSTSYCVPMPNNNNQYYLFTLQQAAYDPILQGTKIYYSIIDMELNGGLGDIIVESKNTLLRIGMTEKIAVVPHTNRIDYWLVTHEIDNNHFLVYKITQDGLSVPDIYASGATPRLNDQFLTIEAQGHIKASPDGKKLGVTFRNINAAEKGNPFQIFDFSDSTGAISNPVTLGFYDSQFGVSFSPDSKRLYLHGFTDDGGPYTFDYLHQFSLDEADIYSSRVGLLINNPNLDRSQFAGGLFNFCLELGPDGRLYGAGGQTNAADVTNRNTLFVIDKPNEKGFACDVSIKQFDFRNGKVSIDLPNFIQSTFKDLESVTECSKETAFSIFPIPTDDIININILAGCTGTFNIQIVNVLGQTIMTETSLMDNVKIDLTALSKGIYFLIIETSYHSKIVKKIIKN